MPEVFARLVDLALARGVSNIQGQLVTVEIDAQWKARINGAGRELEGVPGYHAAVDFNGFPAGIVGPWNGALVAGAIANEETLLAAINAQLSEIEREAQHA